MGTESLRDRIMSPKFRVGSGNYLKDRGYADPEETRTKIFLANMIANTAQERNLSQKEIASLAGLQQPDVSRICNFNLAEYSVWRLMKTLTSIGYDISIGVRSSSLEHGEVDVFEMEDPSDIETPSSVKP